MDAAGPAPPPGQAGVKDGPANVGGVRAKPWPASSPEDLRRAREGDAEALGRFFDHHFERIFAVVQRFVGNRETSEDITQTIFLKVRRRIAHLDIERDPSSWLYTVAINACRDHHRSAWSRMWRQSVPIDSAPESPDLTNPADDPERAYAAAEDDRRVQAALQRLPADLRASVILHDFEGLPHEEIARITNTTHAAARKRHSRALVALATLLGKVGTR